MNIEEEILNKEQNEIRIEEENDLHQLEVNDLYQRIENECFIIEENYPCPKKEEKKNFLRKAEHDIFFFYDKEYHKLLYEANFKEKINQKVSVNCIKANFEFFSYIHKITLQFNQIYEDIVNFLNDSNSNFSFSNLQFTLDQKYHILCLKEIFENPENNELNSLLKFLQFNNENELTSEKNSNILFVLRNTNSYTDNNIIEVENLSIDDKLSINLDKKLIDYALKSNGRLDIYAKAHFILNLISALDKKTNGDLKLKLNNLEILKYFETMEKDLLGIISMGESEKFTKNKFDNLIENFVENLIARNYELKTIKDLKKMIVLYQNINDQQSLKLLENLLIKLMGHPEREIRNESIKLLNIIYDETDWQDRSAFPTKIISIGEKISIELVIRKKDFEEKGLVLILNSPSFSKLENHNRISWLIPNTYESSDISFKLNNQNNYSDIHYSKINNGSLFPSPQNGNLVSAKYNINEVAENPNLIFVKFESNLTISKSGYYDWNLVKFSNGRFATVKFLEIPKLQDELKEAKGRFIAIDKSLKNCTIHEVFADLTNAEIDKEKGKILRRGTFQDIEKKLEDFNKRYINCLYLMGALERDNQICFDTENNNEILDIQNPDASPMAVSCRASVSKLLGGEAAFNSLVSKAKKFSMKILIDSLTRISSSRPHRKYRKILLNTLDQDGKINFCYGSDGHSVNYEDSALLNYRKIESWDILVEDILAIASKFNIDGVHLDNCQSWPQIFDIDHEEMFRLDPDGKQAYTAEEILNGEIVFRSEDCGYWTSDLIDEYPNPFLIKLTKSVWNKFPKFLFVGECWTNNKFQNRHIVLAKSGIVPRMYTLPRALSSVFGRRIHRNGYIENCKPEPVSIIKDWLEENNEFLPEGSLTIQSSCGQVWPYPALLYGRGNWSAIDLLFSLTDIPMTFMDEIEGEAYRVKITNVYSSKDLPKRSSGVGIKSKSFASLDKAQTQEKEEKFSRKRIGSHGNIDNLDHQQKIKSVASLSAISINEIKNLKDKQESIIKEVGPEFGFDLTKIKFHYNHRRKMRLNHESLRNGKLTYLNVFDLNNNVHNNVFAFARSCPEETGVIIINFHSQATSFHLDMKPIIQLFSTQINFNSICYIEDWISEEKGDFYFFKEIINEDLIRTLNPYSSICFGFQIIPFTKENFKRTMEKSISRLVANIKSGKNTDNFQISIQLKYLLEKQLGSEEYAKWFSYVYENLKNYNLSFLDYVCNLNFINQNETISNLFFEYNSKLIYLRNTDISDHADIIIRSNLLGPIAFVTPEIGRWSTVGGLGVMVDELSQGLAKLGQEVIMISPYYERNRKGETGYLQKDPAKFDYIGNIEVNLDQKYIFGVHHGIVNNVKLYFLHNFEIFPSPYPEGTNTFIMKQISLFSKAALELLCFIKTVPALVITNDWFTGLCAAYSKHNHFGETFRGTTFFHIVHNLEPTYEGRIYSSVQEGTLEHIHKLPSYCLVDPYWKARVINPSRCAILMSDQWGTVSPSYRKDLLETSPLASILNMHKKPFAFPNGIFKEQRLKALTTKVGSNKDEAKAKIQMKYFGYENGDLKVPLFSFVGRITQQKGVLLILEAAESIINKYGGRINILVGGMGNPKDPYCASCIQKINHIRGKYPHSFWADPNEFFTDGPLINLGSDFGLMPSVFEPGGIVQHEFFIASTPVLAFKTGGLKDTVMEFDYNTNKGSGILFESHNYNDFIYAIERAMNLFNHKDKFEMCRINAFNSAIDVMDVATMWCREFCRLRNKVFFNAGFLNEIYSNIKNGRFDIETENRNAKLLEILKKFNYKEYVFSKDEFTEEKTHYHILNQRGSQPSIIEGEARIPISFYFTDDSITAKINSVQICGSFDKWQVRHPLTFDPLSNKWTVTLKIRKGSHFYKYIVDGEWRISKGEKAIKDESGFVNNFISF